MRRLLTFLLLTLCALTQAKTLVIAVIDTGIDKSSISHLCKMGHESYVTSLWGESTDPLEDTFGHGTHIAGLIEKNAGNGDYCMVSLRYYAHTDTLITIRKAIRHAIDIGVDFINISGGGTDPDDRERALIQEALNKHITVVVAAGNNGYNLDCTCNYFPACYDKRTVIVGNFMPYNGYRCGDDVKPADSASYMTHKAYSSNYGNVVSRWEIGIMCMSTLPGGHTGTMSGTSQATAVATGKLVKQRLQGNR